MLPNFELYVYLNTVATLTLFYVKRAYQPNLNVKHPCKKNSPARKYKGMNNRRPIYESPS